MTWTLCVDRKSGNCPKVGWRLEKSEIPYCWVDINILQGETRPYRFLRSIYVGQVPVIALNDGRAPPRSNANMTCAAERADLIAAARYDRIHTFEWLYSHLYSHGQGDMRSGLPSMETALRSEAPR